MEETTIEKIQQLVNRIAFDVFGIEFAEQDNIVESVNNSISLMQFLLEIDSYCGVHISLEELASSKNFSELCSLISIKSKSKHSDYSDNIPLEQYDSVSMPLTKIQKAYLTGKTNNFELGKSATFFFAEIVKNTTIEDVEESLNQLIKRHDILRGAVKENGLEMTFDTPSASFVLDSEDISSLSKDEQEEILLKNRERMISAEYSPYDWPLFSVKAFVVEKDLIQINFYFNMLIMDGSSIYIFYQEFCQLLKHENLEEKTISYQEYMRKIKQEETEERYQLSKAYWLEKIQKISKAPRFSENKVYATYRSKRVQTILSKSNEQKLGEISKKLKVSISTILFSIYALILSKWSKLDCFTINFTSTNRLPVKGSNQLLGDFTTSFLVDIAIDDESNFEDFISKIQNEIYNALDHRYFSGVEVIREIKNLHHDMTGATMPVVFTSLLANEEQTLNDFEDIKHIYSQTSQVFLDFQVARVDKGILISWDYVEDYFNFDVRNMFEDYYEKLNELCTNEELNYTHQSMNTNQLSKQYNQTKSTFKYTNLGDLIEGSFSKYADKIAVKEIKTKKEISYEELNKRANRVANYLSDNGIEQGDTVVILADKSITSIANMLGVIKIGGVFVPVDAKFPYERQQYIYRNCQGKILLSDNSYKQSIKEYSEIWQEKNQLLEEDSAYIIYTSGTTGMPKGVEISHLSVTNTIQDINQKFLVSDLDNFLCLSSFSFDLSIYDLFGSLAVGASLFLVDDQRDADTILDSIEKEKISIWNSVPAILELVVARIETRKKYDTLRVILLSGDWIPMNLPDKTKNSFENAEIISLGGATECSIWSIYFPIKRIKNEWSSIPYGYPLANQAIYILNDEDKDCSIGVEGEICIGGLGVAKGYKNNQEKTKTSFFQHSDYGYLYRTGDYGVFVEDGYVVFKGRRDNQVKIRGFRIELEEIENRILTHNLIDKAIVIERENKIIAFIKGKTNSDQLKEYLRKYLPEYMVPFKMFKLEDFPLTSNGKIDKGMLNKLLDEKMNTIESKSESRLDKEQMKVMAIWREILDIEKLSLEDNFFELGGDSIKYQKMLASLGQTFDKEISFRETIDQPTIRHISHVILNSKKRIKTNDFHDDSVNQFENFPLTDMQTAYFLGRNSDFDLGNVSEHYYLEIETTRDIQKLEKSFNQLIKRHPMLRAILLDSVEQRVIEEVPYYSIAIEDTQLLSDTELEKKIADQRKQMSHQQFILDQWPLFEIRAFQVTANKYYLFISLDLMIADGASQNILLHDLMANYYDEELSEISSTFRDYVLYEKSSNSNAKEAEEYQQKVKTFHFGNYLPTETSQFNSPKLNKMSRKNKFIGADNWNKIKLTIQRRGLSLSSVLCAAYLLVLKKWSCTTFASVNVTTYNRNLVRKEVERIVGDFTNTILLSIENKPVSDFWAFAKTVQRLLNEEFDKKYSGAKLISDISRYHNSVGKLVAPVVFTSLLHDFGKQSSDRNYSISNLGTYQYGLSQTPQVLLDNQLMEIDGLLMISWDYVDAAFDDEVIDEMFQDYLDVLNQMIKLDDQITVSKISIKGNEHIQENQNNNQSSRASIMSEKANNLKFSSNSNDDSEQLFSTLREVLKVQINHLTDNLFELGCDSITLIRLVKRLEKQFNCTLSVASILTEPTVRNLLIMIQEGKNINELENNHLIKLKDGNKNKHLFFIHGGFGTIEIYSKLLTELSKDYTIWGIEYAYSTLIYPSQVTIKKLAKEYVQQIKKIVNDEDQIYLVGWSLGGVIAFEIANQLPSSSYHLVLIDADMPNENLKVQKFSVEGEKEFLKQYLPESVLESINQEKTIENIWNVVERYLSNLEERIKFLKTLDKVTGEKFSELPESISPKQCCRYINTLRSLISARDCYVPENKVKYLVFVKPEMGLIKSLKNWQKYCHYPIQSIEIEGNHYTIFDEKSKELAATLNFVLKVNNYSQGEFS